MKICSLTNFFYPQVVGAGTSAYLQARELAKRGHDVTAVTDAGIQGMPGADAYPFKVHFVESFGDFAYGRASFKRPTEQIYEILEEGAFDVLHVRNFMPMLLISLIRPLVKCPVVFTFHNTPNGQQQVLRFYESAVLDQQLARSIIDARKYDRIVEGSRVFYNFALQLGADPATTVFSYQGIDHEAFEEDLARSRQVDLRTYFGDQLSDEDVLITLPGRVVARKGTLEALQALEEVNKQQPVKLLLTGMPVPYDATFVQTVRQEVERRGLSGKVVVPSKVIARHDLPAVYKRSNIVITPSYYEGLGNTTIEALKAGRPVVATDAPGINEIAVDGQNALTVPPADAQALTNAILKLLHDKSLAERLAGAGPESVRKFDVRRHVDTLEQVYQQLQ